MTVVSGLGHHFFAPPKREFRGCERKGGSLSEEAYLTGSEPMLSGSTATWGQPLRVTPSRLEIPSTHQWFALRVKSNFERITAMHLRQRGYEEFLPLYGSRKRWSDRLKSVEKPLFPGYIFCSFDPLLRLPILTTPGVLHVVGIGKEPVPIDQREVEAVWTTLQSGLLVSPWPFLESGQKVIVERGPLAGVEGIVTEVKRACRLVVSVTLLQRSISAEIERDWIRPIGELSHRRNASTV